MAIATPVPRIDVKDAVAKAKVYVADLFSDETLFNLGLEEVEWDGEAEVWRVTLGFSRPWNTARNAFTAISGEQAAKRAYRVVTMRGDGEVMSLKRREAATE